MRTEEEGFEVIEKEEGIFRPHKHQLSSISIVIKNHSV